MSIVKQSATGHATNIIGGLAIGMESTFLPMIVLAAGIFGSYHFAGLYGVAIAAAGEEALPEVAVAAAAANVEFGAVAAVAVVTVSNPPFLNLVVPLSLSIILHALIPLNVGLWLLLSLLLSLLLLVVVVNAAARVPSSITTNLSSSSSHILLPPGTVIIPVVAASTASAGAAVELESSREG